MAIQPKKKRTSDGAGLILFEVDGDFEALCALVRAASPRINGTHRDGWRAWRLATAPDFAMAVWRRVVSVDVGC